MALFQWVIWTSYMIANFINKQPTIALVNLLLTALSSLVIFYFYFRKSKLSAISNSLAISLNTILLFILILVFGFNQVLLAENNKSLNYFKYQFISGTSNFNNYCLIPNDLFNILTNTVNISYQKDFSTQWWSYRKEKLWKSIN